MVPLVSKEKQVVEINVELEYGGETLVYSNKRKLIASLITQYNC